MHYVADIWFRFCVKTAYHGLNANPKFSVTVDLDALQELQTHARYHPLVAEIWQSNTNRNRAPEGRRKRSKMRAWIRQELSGAARSVGEYFRPVCVSAQMLLPIFKVSLLQKSPLWLVRLCGLFQRESGGLRKLNKSLPATRRVNADQRQQISATFEPAYFFIDMLVHNEEI